MSFLVGKCVRRVSGGFLLGRVPLGPDPRSQSLHLAMYFFIARTFPFGISSALTWLAACLQSLKQSPFMCQLMHILVFPDGPFQEGFSLVCSPTKSFFQSSSSFIFSSGCCKSFVMCLFPSSLGFGLRFFLSPSFSPGVSSLPSSC